MTDDFLQSIQDRMEETRKTFNIDESPVNASLQIVRLDPHDIDNWEYRDRQDFEMGDITELADSIELKGQAQPIIVVNAGDVFHGKNKTAAKYIVIAGYRRWLACKQKNIQVEAIIRQLTFEQAIACVVSENEKEQVSDYSKGMFYVELLKRESITKKALSEKLGIKRSMFNNYLSFDEVPVDIWLAVGDLSKVSARTSSTIKLICQRSEAHHQAIKNIANKIADGIGEKTITNLVEQELNKNKRLSISATRATRVVLSRKISIKSSIKGIHIDLKGLSEAQHQKVQNTLTQVLTDIAEQLELE